MKTRNFACFERVIFFQFDKELSFSLFIYLFFFYLFFPTEKFFKARPGWSFLIFSRLEVEMILMTILRM